MLKTDTRPYLIYAFYTPHCYSDTTSASIKVAIRETNKELLRDKIIIAFIPPNLGLRHPKANIILTKNFTRTGPPQQKKKLI